MNISLQGRKAIVTAGGAGLGRVIAGKLAAAGARVWVCDRDARPLEELRRDSSGIDTAQCDVSDAAAAAAFVDRAIAAMGGLDILVNNAGIAGPTAAPEDVTPAEWDQVMAVNVNGLFYVTRAAIPALKAASGASVVNISSIAAAKGGYPMRLPYATSKVAVLGFTETLAMDLGRFGVNVNSILPGGLIGPRLKAVMERSAAARGVDFAEECRIALAENSMRTFITRDEVADLVHFLCSPAGRHISGQAISVCGNTEGERSWMPSEPPAPLPDPGQWES